MEVNDFISSSQVLENSSVDLSSSLPALINQFQQHIQEERYAALSLKECEMHPIVIKRFLVAAAYSVPDALRNYQSWVEWRREVKADNIDMDCIQPYIDRQEAVWQGRNKQLMRCCYITGRHHNPLSTTGHSFRQFLIHIVEKGCLHDAARESEVNETESCLGRKESKETSSTNLEQRLEVSNDEVCLIYDRRGLEYSHIDPVTFHNTSSIVGELQSHYRQCVGAIYIVHINIFFWVLYSILRPIFQYVGGQKIVLLYDARDILEYISESQLPEGFLEDTVLMQSDM